MVFHPTERAIGPVGRTARSADAVVVRTVLSTCPSLRLRAGDAGTDLIDAHAVLPDGTVVVAVDAMTAVGGRLVAARGRPAGVRLDLTRLVAVPVRSRVRARVTVRGTVRPFDPATLDACDTDTVLGLLDLPAAALWAIEPVDIRLERDRVDAPVTVADYRAACPDPVAAVETTHVQHLARHHLERVAALADPGPVAVPTRFVPIAIEAGGLTVRAEAAHRHHDIFLPFNCRVESESALVGELRSLLTRPVGSRPTGRTG